VAGQGLTFRSKSVGCGYCSHTDRPSFRRSYPSQSLFIGPGIGSEHHQRAHGQTGVHARSTSPRGMPSLRLEDIPPISMTFSTCGSYHGPRVHRTTSLMGGTGHHGSSRSRFSEVREPPEKGSNRLETASMRNARTSYPVEPQSRRPHATMATFSRTFIVLTRCIQWRMSSPPHIVTERKQADNRPPHTNDVGTGHKADRAGYKPAMTSAGMTYPMCDAGPA
jgi:hypothetical protein